MVEALDLDDITVSADGPPVTELSDVELLREFQYLRVELMELRELSTPPPNAVAISTPGVAPASSSCGTGA